MSTADESTGLPPVCSAKGCTATARWALLWNNPRLHTPDRRKTWLACEEHRDTLGGFLAARGFLRDREPLGRLTGADDPRSPSTG